MENLTLTEVLEYYNCMDFKTGNPKLYKHFDSATTKKLALEEIVKRTDAYRKENRIAEKVAELAKLATMLPQSFGKRLTLLFIDTRKEGCVKLWAESIGYQTLLQTNSSFMNLIQEIEKNRDELYNIGEYDPDNLRYKSKFPGSSNNPEYYSHLSLNFNYIQTEHFSLNYQVSHEFHDSLYSRMIFYGFDVVIYPHFASGTTYFLPALLAMFNSMNSLRTLFCIMMINDEVDYRKTDIVLSEYIEYLGRNALLNNKNIKFILISHQKYKDSDYSDLLLTIDKFFINK